MTSVGLLTLGTSFGLVARWVFRSKFMVLKSVVFISYVWMATHVFTLGEHLGVLFSLNKSVNQLY